MDKYKIGSYLLVLIIIFLVARIAYIYASNFLQSNFFLALVTLVVGGFAIYLYIKQNADTKRDAAKIVLQEIRRAEDIISDYKQSGGYQFAKKIIATNSWNKNIHLFVSDFENDELDRISNLYSTGEYLDRLVGDISKITLEYEVEIAKKEIIKMTADNLILTGSEQQNQPKINNLFIPSLPPVWKRRMDATSRNLEMIYNTRIVDKLKKIAGIK